MIERAPGRPYVFQALVFLGAFLLFDLELIAAKLLLPRFGSSAAVWITSLAFFQGVLVGGYLIAAAATRRPEHRWAHLVLVAAPLVALPLHLPETMPGSTPPLLAVASTLALGVGLPCLALSTTSVVAQHWLHLRSGSAASDPAHLYGLSSAGSLAALLSYPLAVEPLLDMGWQCRCWTAGYGLFVALHLACLPPRGARLRESAATPTEPWQLAWLLLPAAGSALLSATTQALTAEASVPLLWVVPLALYLATWVAAFPGRSLPPIAVRLLFATTLLATIGGFVLMRGRTHYEWGVVLHQGGLLTTGCLLAHLAVAALRPADPGARGPYFLSLAAGGWLGSLAVGIVLPAIGAPFAFLDQVVALGLLLAGFAARSRLGGARTRWILATAGLGGLAATGALVAWGRSASVDAVRTFYGFYRVSDRAGLRYFLHGSTVHGVEAVEPERQGEPLAYFHRLSPIGQLLEAGVARATVGVVGLGAGSLAAYARPGERWDFFELDPEVERLARKDFHFLERTRGEVRVIVGDARQSLAGVPPRTYDLLIIDAFARDFVPLHLLDREALELDLERLRPGGLLVFHVSSRLLDLVPVLARLAKAVGAEGVSAESPALPEEGAFASVWVALSTDPGALPPSTATVDWRPLRLSSEEEKRRPWSDDYVNLFDAWRR